jgi:hypothetical protein
LPLVLRLSAGRLHCVEYPLSRFGYYSVSLVSAHYFAAGVWALILPWRWGGFVLYASDDAVSQDAIHTKPLVWILFIVGTAASNLLLFSEWIGRLAPGLRLVGRYYYG